MLDIKTLNTMKTQPVRIPYQFDQIPKLRTFAIYSKSGFYKKFNFIVAFNPDFAKFYFYKEHGKYSKILSVSECDFYVK